MDEPSASMEDDRMASSFLMDDPRALQFDSVVDARCEDELQISQVSYLFRSLCNSFRKCVFFYDVWFPTYSAHI